MLYLLDRPDQHPDWLVLYKSAAEPGTRWITVHPNGKDEKGVAVLIRESHSTPGTWHVIGGADGKLTHMTLDHIGSKADWAQRSKERKAQRKAEGKETPETREAAKAANKKNRIAFVNKVAKEMGWDEHWYKTAEDYILQDPTLQNDAMAAGIMAERNLGEHVKKANAAVAQYHRRLRADAEARTEAGLGDLSFDNNPFRATEADLDFGQLADKVVEHIDAAFQARQEEASDREDEASAYEGLAAQLASLPDDATSAEVGALVTGLGQPNTAEARTALKELRTADLTPADAATKLQQTANGLRKNDIDLLGGSDAKSHQEVADLYRQAQSAMRDGDGDAAARYVEQAKKLTGDYNVGALDLIGQKAKEGKGYQPVERQRAREDVREKGEDRPEVITARIANKTKHLDELQRDPSGAGQVLAKAVEKQIAALNVARQAATEGRPDDAADAILVAQKEEVWEDDLADKLADVGDDGLPNIGKAAAAVTARDKLVASHERVRTIKASSGGGGGGGRSGGVQMDGPDLDMSKAAALLKAKGEFARRKKDITEAREASAQDADAFKTAMKDPRVDESPLTDAEVKAMIGKIQKLGESDTHARLLDAVENPEEFFGASGAGDQIARGSVARWVDTGRDAMIQLVGQLSGTGVEIDRARFANLGVKGGCALLAQHMANTMDPHDLADTLDGLREYHSGRAFNVASQAIRAAESCLKQAGEFDLSGKKDAYDLSEANHYNKLRMQAVDQALASVGTAYGELNATAEMIWALGGARPASDGGYTIKGGDKDREGLVVQARSLGLDEGDYTVVSPKYDPVNKQAIPGRILLTPGAAPKLFGRRDAGEQQRERTLEAIKGGRDVTVGGRTIKGDEDGWLPRGIARRPKSAFDDPEQRPDQFAKTTNWAGTNFDSPEGEAAVRDHIGARLADGIPVEQLFNEMHHPDAPGQAGLSGRKADQFRAAVGKVFPEDYDETWRGRAMQMADDLVRRHVERTGVKDVALHSQTLDAADPRASEAIHRSLAQNPYGTLAFKEVGKLTAADKVHLRDYAYKHLWGVATDEPDKDALENDEQEPAPQANSFGSINSETLPQGNPADPHAERWNDYVRDMDGREPAYRALIDHIKGDTARAFQQSYGQVTGTPIRLGQERIRGGARHFYAHADDATRKRIDDAVASRGEGVTEAQARDRMVTRLAADQPAAQSPERATVGQAMEKQLKSLWGNASDSFTPGKPLDLTKTRGLSMDGRYITQQRMVKAIRANKRMGLFAGVGSGKSLIILSGYTDANSDGEASHALIAAPQNMVGQLGAEAATYLDPAKGYRWHAKPGASREERESALASKEHHIAITTHQSLRDDAIRAIAEHQRIEPAQAEDLMREAPRKTRAQMLKRAFEHKGWDHRFQYFAVDEGHVGLNRKGKENSLMANVLDAISDNSKHYVPATGTNTKNDLSEAYDWLSKLDGDRYPEERRANWLRDNAGVGAIPQRVAEARQGAASTPTDPKDWTNIALAERYQHAVAPYFYQSRVPLDQPLTRRNVEVALSPAHQAAYDRVTGAYARANAARARGTFDSDALRELSPGAFIGKEERDHPAIARSLHAGLAMTRDAAYNRALHATATDNAKLDKLAEIAAEYKHQGKPGIVFAHNLDAVHAVAARLKAEGHRVGTITGNDDARTKERVKQGFQPPSYQRDLALGDPHRNAAHDILVCSDAVSAGADLPRGEFVMNYDTPMTAATHEQRTARAHRLSTRHPVEQVNLISHTPYEQANWQRLQTKYALSDVSQNPAEKADESGLQMAINNAMLAGNRRRALEGGKGKQRAAS